MDDDASAAALLAQHARRPQNMGRLSEATAVGNVGSITVGRALRFFLKVDAAGRIEAAKFQVFACPEMIPSASLLTTLVVGLSCSQAGRIDRQQLAAAAGVEASALPLWPWGLEALRHALRLQAGEEWLVPPPAVDETLICRCFGISEATIKESIEGGAEEVDDLVASTGAGQGCGTCRRDLQRLLERMLQRGAARLPAAGGEAGSGGVSGRVSLMKRIEVACRPLLQAAVASSGGAAELWDLRDASVVLRLQGPLAAAGPERSGLLERIDRILKDEVDPTLQVVVDEA